MHETSIPPVHIGFTPAKHSNGIALLTIGLLWAVFVEVVVPSFVFSNSTRPIIMDPHWTNAQNQSAVGESTSQQMHLFHTLHFLPFNKWYYLFQLSVYKNNTPSVYFGFNYIVLVTQFTVYYYIIQSILTRSGHVYVILVCTTWNWLDNVCLGT